LTISIKDFALGAKIVQIAADKVNLTFTEGLTRGILCNVLVCLAVWLCYSARTVVSKVAAIIFPITAFVALGFEHSIANMYFIPLGLVLKNNSKVLESLSRVNPNINLSNLNITGFLGSLLSVTIGNIIGGAILVGIVYWVIIIYPKKMKEHIRERIKK
jgi:formate transporter